MPSGGQPAQGGQAVPPSPTTQPTTQPGSPLPFPTDPRKDAEDELVRTKTEGMKIAVEHAKAGGVPMSQSDVSQASALPGRVGLGSAARGFGERFDSWAMRLKGVADRTEAAFRNIVNARARTDAALTIMASSEFRNYERYARQADMPDQAIVSTHKPPEGALAAVVPGGWVDASDAENAPAAVKEAKRIVEMIHRAAAASPAGPVTRPVGQ